MLKALNSRRRGERFGSGVGEYTPTAKGVARFDTFLTRTFGLQSTKVQAFCKKEGLDTRYIDTKFVGPVVTPAQSVRRATHDLPVDLMGGA